MGRISKALDKLRRKCTSEGAHPNGKSIADQIECIADHYSVNVGYDGISGGNITEVDGKNILTPLGAGTYTKSFNSEFTMTATEDGEITWGEEPIADGGLIVGETYRVTVNGVTGDYGCYVDENGLKIIGTFEEDMAVGDWQIADVDTDYLVCNVFGNVNDVFDISVVGKVNINGKVRPEFLDKSGEIDVFCKVAFYNNEWHVERISGGAITIEEFDAYRSSTNYGLKAFSFYYNGVSRSLVPFFGENEVDDEYYLVACVGFTSVDTYIKIFKIVFDISGEYVGVTVTEEN